MRDSEGGRLLAANLLVAVSAALSAVLPGALLEGFSVLGTHRSWMAACAAAVGTASAALHLALRPGQPHRRSSFAYKLYVHITCLGESFCAFLVLGNALLFVVPAICMVAEDGKIGWAQNSFPSPGLAGLESEMVKETLAQYNLNKVGQFNKISRFLKCCIYFFMSCILFHAIIVLYGAPLIESVTETFLFAVLLSTFTTLQCLCILGPNIQAWIRVFSKNGAMSIWESSLQITTVCSILGAWFGAFPIPLDWDRPWQVWPISCSLGATFGYMAGLIIAPLWIHWNRKQLTYKSR